MMGWDDEDAVACEEARENASTASDFKGLLWFSIPAALGALVLVAKFGFDLF
jgi:hypothetical protein